ncbi:peptide ABC transporter substrate-binding protein [Bacillus marinisedimentorum]|uniref:peptide ABC transporter substrate-binding protein n=1 Tax=Bacillus marinisedimentorum TaxID=1821260 RepID=UPI0008721875
MKKKLSIFFVLVLALSMFLAACGGGNEGATNENEGNENESSENATGGEGEGGEAKPDEEQVLNLLESAEIPSMDPITATDQVSFIVMNNVFEGLYRLGPDNKPVPGVAKDYEKDGTKYTFTLNENAKWSDGSQVTAQDFEYAWKRALSPDTLAEYAYIMGDLKNANKIMDEESDLYGKVEELGVKAVDEKTLEVELENDVPYFLGLTSFGTFMPLKKDYVEEQGKNYALEADTMLYNGPFVLSEWNHEQNWKYEKNDQYWDKEAVKLDEINVNVIKDTATAVNLFETGKTDRAALSAEYVDQYKDTENYVTTPDAAVYFLRLNQKNEALANVDIRKAISMGWDKKGLTDVILNNGSTPADYLVPKDFVSGPDGEDFRAENGDMLSHDADKAKEHFEKGLEALGQDSLELELLNYDSENSKKVGEYLKNQLEKNLPGLTVSIKAQPFKQKLDLETKGDYDFSFAGWGPDYQDPMTFIDMFVTDGAHNQMAYSNEEYDKLVEEAKTDLSDLEARWDKLQEAERILLEEDAAIAPMYQRGNAHLMKTYVKDWVKHPFGGDYSFKWTYISGKN